MGPGRGQGGMGMGGGPGFGPRPRARDDVALEKQRARGKLSGKGEINEVIEFRGLPDEVEARAELVEMTRAAAQEAEEALGREEIPRRRREAVRSYFESVQPK
jgi:hypothetical protein